MVNCGENALLQPNRTCILFDVPSQYFDNLFFCAIHTYFSD